MTDYPRVYTCQCADCCRKSELYISPDHIKGTPLVMIGVEDHGEEVNVWLSLDDVKTLAGDLLTLVFKMEE